MSSLARLRPRVLDSLGVSEGSKDRLVATLLIGMFMQLSILVAEKARRTRGFERSIVSDQSLLYKLNIPSDNNKYVARVDSASENGWHLEGTTKN